MFCEKCGKKVKKSALYCKKCGIKVTLEGLNGFNNALSDFETVVKSFESENTGNMVVSIPSTANSKPKRKKRLIPIVVAGVLVLTGIVVGIILLNNSESQKRQQITEEISSGVTNASEMFETALDNIN